MLKQRLVSPILMWAIVVTGIGLTVKFAPTGAVFDQNTFVSLLIIPATLYWLYFFTGAIKVNRQAARSVAGIKKIINTGVYKIIRHPIYSADIILAFGVFLYQPSIKILLSVAWLSVVLLSWIKLEEKFLEQKFGQEYKNYRNIVPMVIPLFTVLSQKNKQNL